MMLLLRVLARLSPSRARNTCLLCSKSVPSFKSKLTLFDTNLVKLAAGCQFFCTSTARHQTPPNQRSKALILLSDLKELRTSPRSALALGFGGLIPFVIPPVYFLSTLHMCDALVNSQLVYGAVILSFLGGIQWGYLLSEANQGPSTLNWKRLSHSVIPAVIGWSALLVPTDGAMLCLIGGHGYALYRDMTLAIYPPWFRALRFILSLTAIVALWTTFICGFAYKNTNTGLEKKTL